LRSGRLRTNSGTNAKRGRPHRPDSWPHLPGVHNEVQLSSERA
jgi:hypothetical protein